MTKSTIKPQLTQVSWLDVLSLYDSYRKHVDGAKLHLQRKQMESFDQLRIQKTRGILKSTGASLPMSVWSEVTTLKWKSTALRWRHNDTLSCLLRSSSKWRQREKTRAQTMVWKAFLLTPGALVFRQPDACMATVMVVLPTHPEDPVPPLGQNGAFGSGY